MHINLNPSSPAPDNSGSLSGPPREEAESAVPEGSFESDLQEIVCGAIAGLITISRKTSDLLYNHLLSEARPLDFYSTAFYARNVGSADIFYEHLTMAVSRARHETALTPEIVGSLRFLLLLARCPDYADDVCALFARLGAKEPLNEERAYHFSRPHPLCLADWYAKVAALGSSENYYCPSWRIATELVHWMACDAIAQGKPLSSARYWDTSSNQFLTAPELIERFVQDTNASKDAFRDWSVGVSASLWFWGDLYDTLSKAPSSFSVEAVFPDLRAVLEESFHPCWLKCQQMWLLGQWNCFKEHHNVFTNGKGIASALLQLLPFSAEESKEGNSSYLASFTHALWFDGGRNWIRQIPLSWAAALYRGYVDAHKGGKMSYAPFQQMLLATDYLSETWEKEHPAFLDIVKDRDPASLIIKKRREIEASLATMPLTIPLDDPIRLLLTARSLGFDYAERAQNMSVADLINTFTEDLSSGRIAPLQPEWVERLTWVPRVKVIKESSTTASVEDIYLQRVEEIRTFFRIRDSRTSIPGAEAFLATPIGVLLDQATKINRYSTKFRGFEKPAAVGRSNLLALVELFSEILNTARYSDGPKETIPCVQVPSFFDQLRDEIAFETLLHGIREEFRLHDEPSHMTGKSLEVAFRPTRGVVSEFIGHICNTCFTRVSGFAKNAPWATFITFIKNPTVDERNDRYPTFAGGSIVIETQAVAANGLPERVLLIRGYNPSNSLLKTVHAGALFDEFVSYLRSVAKDRGISRILIPKDPSWGLMFTNRPYAFLDVEKRIYSAAGVEMMTLVSPSDVALNELPVTEGLVVP